MREINDNALPITPRFVEAIDGCIQCRGCETACPSGVPYGRLISGARAGLVEEDKLPSPRWLTLSLRALRWHPLVLIGSTMAAIGQRLGVPLTKLGLPPLSLRRTPLVATGTDVFLHTGCVMDAWYRPVHQATLDVLSSMGVGAKLAGSGGACCGALSEHAGDHKTATQMAQRTMKAFAGDEPIIVNSAGCGAAMKEYGEHLGTTEARVFSARVVDLFEYLEQHADQLPETSDPAKWSGTVAIQDPCHLRHVQQVHGSVHTVLARFGETLTLDDEGLCCGAGGSYSVTHPGIAADVRQRKIDSIERTSAKVVASANPGCAGHLAAGGVETCHPIELVAQALRTRT